MLASAVRLAEHRVERLAQRADRRAVGPDRRRDRLRVDRQVAVAQ
jgi:hypothetical protein